MKIFWLTSTDSFKISKFQDRQFQFFLDIYSPLHLVEIDSWHEQQALNDEIFDIRGWTGDSHFGFWIGLTDIFHDGTWVWENVGKPLNFSNWAPGEPNNFKGGQHCVAMKLGNWGNWWDGKWDDLGCENMKTGNFTSEDTTIGYICEAAGDTNPDLCMK